MEDSATGRADDAEGVQWSRMQGGDGGVPSEDAAAEDAAVVAARPQAAAGWARSNDVGPGVEAIPAHFWATQQDISGKAQVNDVAPGVEKPAAIASLLPSLPPSATSNTRSMEEWGERVIYNCIYACIHV